MKKPEIIINGTAYPLATTLRVAYKIQSMNEHKSYADVFKDLASLSVEKQIDIVFASFICANKDTTFKPETFREYCFDNFNVGDLMNLLGDIVNGIIGETGEAPKETDAGDEKN